jgi:hypothetical protein
MIEPKGENELTKMLELWPIIEWLMSMKAGIICFWSLIRWLISRQIQYSHKFAGFCCFMAYVVFDVVDFAEKTDLGT